MAKYYNADALMKELEQEVELADDWKTAHEIVNVVKYFPTIELEQKKGKWISELVKKEDRKGNTQSYYQPISCSLCHAAHYEESRCCPNCGAKMEDEE